MPGASVEKTSGPSGHRVRGRVKLAVPGWVLPSLALDPAPPGCDPATRRSLPAQVPEIFCARWGADCVGAPLFWAQNILVARSTGLRALPLGGAAGCAPGRGTPTRASAKTPTPPGTHQEGSTTIYSDLDRVLESARTLAEEADEQVRDLRRGRPLIVVDRNTSVGRSSYTGPAPVTSARPTLAVGCYASWDPARPLYTLAAEHHTSAAPGQRPGEDKMSRWWPLVLEQAVEHIARDPHPPIIKGWFINQYHHSLLGSPAAFTGKTLIGMPAGVRYAVENKIALESVLDGAGVATQLRVPARTYRGRLPSLERMRRDVGSHRLVIQTAHGAGGLGTVFVEREEDLSQVPTQGPWAGTWRVSRFLPGWSSNTTVLSVPDGNGGVNVYVDRPSHSAVGLPELGVGSAKSAGNDWSWNFPREGVSALVEAAVRIGRWAWNEHRMSGLWGIDAIWTPDGVPHINEINARSQSCTEHADVSHQLLGYPSLSVAHLVAGLGGNPAWLPSPEEFNTAAVRAVSTPGSWAPYYLKVRALGPVRVRSDFPGPGVYRLTDDKTLIQEEAGAHPALANSDAGRVLLANTPLPGALCLPGAELAVVEGVTTGSTSPFAEPSQLSVRGRDLLHAINHILTQEADETVTDHID